MREQLSGTALDGVLRAENSAGPVLSYPASRPAGDDAKPETIAAGYEICRILFFVAAGVSGKW